jgi:hypothetical protein
MCICPCYEFYDVEETRFYVYDPEANLYMEKNDEINGPTEEPIQKEDDDKDDEDDIMVYMDEHYLDYSDTEDTYSIQVMFDLDENFEIMTDDEDDSPV